MGLEKRAGLAVGYLLLLAAAALLLNAVKVATTAVLFPVSAAPAWAVVAALMLHEGGLLLCYFLGRMVLQRVRHPGFTPTLDADRGRVLGP